MTNYALLIACGSYDDDAIPNVGSAVADATRLAEVLEDRYVADYSVTVLANPSLVGAQLAVHTVLAGAAPTDVVLVHLSGHGLRDSAGRFHLAVPETDRGALPATSLAGRYLRERMTDSRCNNVIVVLDCCYAGAFGKDMMAKGASYVGGLTEEFGQSCQAILSASSAVQYAFEIQQDDGWTSVFTRALTRGLRTGEADLDNDGLVALGEWFAYARDEVVNRHAGQTPELYLLGANADIVIGRRAPRSTRDISGEVLAALRSQHAELRSGAVAVLQRMTRGTDRYRSEKARELIAEVRTDSSEVVRRAAERALRDSPPSTSSEPAFTKPLMSPESASQWVTVSASQLRRAVYVASRTRSEDETQPQLQNIVFRHSGTRLTVAATNRYRLDVRYIDVEGGGSPFDVLVDGDEVAQLDSFSEGNVSLFVDSSDLEVVNLARALRFHVTSATSFPDYEKLLTIGPKERQVTSAARGALLDAVDRFVADIGVPVILEVDEEAPHQLQMRSGGAGDQAARVDLEASMQPISFALNPYYFEQAVSAFDEDRVVIAYAGPIMPLHLRNSDASHLHLVMPVRLTDDTYPSQRARLAANAPETMLDSEGRTFVSIRAAARALKSTQKQIRSWQQLGVVAPSSRYPGYYSTRQFALMHAMQRLQAAGFSENVVIEALKSPALRVRGNAVVLLEGSEMRIATDEITADTLRRTQSSGRLVDLDVWTDALLRDWTASLQID